MSTQTKDALLVLKAQSGDLRSLDQLLASLQQPLFRFIVGIVGEEMLAEDILQDVFMIICRKIKWLKDARFFRGWAYRIASREAIRKSMQAKRQAHRIEDLQDVEHLPQPEPTDSSDSSLVKQLPAVLKTIPPSSRVVLLLHYQEELSLQAVADILDLPAGTVKSRLAYGLSLLRTTLHHTTKR